MKLSKPYLIELAQDVIGWFIGGAVGAMLLDTFDVNELGNVDVWKAAAGMGVLGVLKGLAGRFIGDPDTTSWRRS